MNWKYSEKGDVVFCVKKCTNNYSTLWTVSSGSMQNSYDGKEEGVVILGEGEPYLNWGLGGVWDLSRWRHNQERLQKD